MTNTTQDLTTMTPPEIDTELADLHGQRFVGLQRAVWALDSLHRMVGDKRERRGRSEGPWGMTEDEVLAAADLVASYERRSWDRQVEALDEARATIRTANSEIRLRDAEFDRRGGWSRFWLVKNSGGHIHSSMACSTCYPTTWFGWLPALSGLTEADAVAEHGTILCSICFPSAPVEWTVGKAQTDGCPGSGKYVEVEGRARFARYRTCPDCGKSVAVKDGGGLRKHKAA